MFGVWSRLENAQREGTKLDLPTLVVEASVAPMFTALHQALGQTPGPITNAMIDEAIERGIPESQGLDWKAQLPPKSNLSQTDFPKDIAAMANAGGGVLVYGVREVDKCAVSREVLEELDQAHERTLRQVAWTAITPPVLDLAIHRLGPPGGTVAIVIGPSVDGPHLIYRDDRFAAPRRVDADTKWMTERDLEAAYRDRLYGRARAQQALDDLFEETAAAHEHGTNVWIVGVARPRLTPTRPRRLGRSDLESFWDAVDSELQLRPGSPPASWDMDINNPRPGLRRAVFPAYTDDPRRQCWASVHDDGSVTHTRVLTDPEGVAKRPQAPTSAAQVRVVAAESAIALFLAMTAASGHRHEVDEFDVKIGIVWESQDSLMLVGTDSFGHFDNLGILLRRFTPIRATIPTRDGRLFHQAVVDIASDAINQCGVTDLRAILAPN